MKKNYLLFLILLFPLLGLAQKNVVADQFSSYKKNVIQEKLLMTLDRPAYLAEEIIWFKIYLVDASLHQPLDLSKVAYVELLDQNNLPVLQAKIAMKNGKGSGSFQIPKDIQSGRYHLRAYTNWMKNFDPSLFYHKELTILGASTSTATNSNNEYDIQFFPEGGALISGIKSKVAYKIVNGNGLGEDFNGTIINAKNDTISRFAAGKYGMGSFMVDATVNDNLTAIFKNASGKILRKELPKASSSGIAMNLVRGANGQITVNAYLSNYNSNAVTLLAHTRNQIGFNETKSFANGVVSFQLNEKDLKDGISQFTLFDAQNRPVCERLYFKKPASAFHLQVNSNQANYQKRAEVALNLSAKENANVSVSVYRADELNLAGNENLSAYLWLSSELKGTIEHPEFYLDPNVSNSTEADNLMLAQGWRRFKWTDILANKAFEPSYVPEYRGLIIHTALNTTNNIKTFLTVLETLPKTFFSQTKTNGESSFLANYYGKKTLIFQTSVLEDSVSKFTMISPFITNDQVYSKRVFPLSNIANFSSRYTAAQVQARYYAQQFQPVTEKDLNIGTSTRMTYNIDDYVKFATIGETIKEYIRGVSTYKENDKQYIKVSYKNDLNYLDYMPDKALVLFDGIPTFNDNEILAYKTVNIDQISVLQEKYVDDDINMGGVVMIKSKDKSLSQFKSPNALIIDYEGVQEERIFYAPKYHTETEKNSKLPDFRNLLYWNADVDLVKDTPAKLNFFTADQTGKYIGVIEGLSAKGKPGYQLISFEVK